MATDDSRKGGGWAQVAVAVVTVAGSLAGAWIAAGAKFERELDRHRADIADLRRSLDAVRADLDAKAARAAEAEDRLRKLAAQIELARAGVDALAKAKTLVLGDGRGR